MAGTNDLGFEAESTPIVRSVTGLHELAHALDIPTLAVGIPPSAYQAQQSEAAELCNLVNRELRAWANDQQDEMCAFIENPISYWAPDDLRFAPDGLHFSPEGYRVVGEGLADVDADSVRRRQVENRAANKPKSGWKAPQDAQTRAKALQDGAPATPDGLQRCWECFPDLPPATSFDWLGRGSAGEKDRSGQPMKRFLQPGPHRHFPTRQRSKIYLCPLGDVSGAPPARIFAELLRRWFLLEVVVMRPPSKSTLGALERDEDGCGYGAQLECPSAHALLHSLSPRDAFIVLGYTMEDLTNSSKGFNFLFGEANLDKGVGIFSFARYAEGVPADSPRFLRRCGMVLCHEATHCFGVRHCVYASCIMNGSNHLEESENRPFSCCPVDLRKIQLTLDQAKVGGKEQPPVDLVARERSLIEWFEEHGLHEDAKFSRTVLSALTGMPVGGV